MTDKAHDADMRFDPSELDDLWDFEAPAQSETRLRRALAAATGERALVLRTQLARSLGLQSRFDECSAELDLVAAAIEAGTPEHDTAEHDTAEHDTAQLGDTGGGGGPVEACGDAREVADRADTDVVRVYLALERGRQLRSAGHPAESRAYFLDALDLASGCGLDYLAADAAHMLAIIGPPQEQVAWAERALAIAAASTDRRARQWVGSISNNLGWTLHTMGRLEEAQNQFDTALRACEERGDPDPIRIARWTVARGLRSLGRLAEALAIQEELARSGPSDGYVEEELGEILLASGKGGEAGPHFARAHELLSADAWLVESEPQRLERLRTLAG